MLLRLAGDQVAPAQGVSGGMRQGQREHRQDEYLRVPKCVTIVAGPCQPFGCDGSALPTRPRLRDVEEGEAYRLLDLRVGLELNVGMCPEVVQVGPLLREQALPAGQGCGGERADALTARGWSCPDARA